VDKLERFRLAYTGVEDSHRIRLKPIHEDDENEGSEGSKETANTSGMKSRENGTAEPVYNSSQEELNKDNSAIPCAFCEHSFSDEEAVSHMMAAHPKISG
jgi:hypothetical protein